MMWYRNLLTVIGLLLINLFSAQSCNFDDFVNDLSQGNAVFKSIVNQEDGFKAWQILAEEAPALRKNADELNLVSKNLSAIEKAGGYKKWKGLGGSNIDFSTMDISGAVQHVKFRDASVVRNRGIGGCHDEIEFAKLRQINAVGNINYKVLVGKTLDEVEEIVITGIRSSTTPGIKIIEYKIPAIDTKLKTTGELKGNGASPFTKSIYDPVIWTDTKLEKALKEALQDAKNKHKLFIESPTSGLTSEGYKLTFTTQNGKVSSFWFD